jgi:predicted ATPase
VAWGSFKPPSSSTKPASFQNMPITFKHALTHEVAYNSLLQERRRALHTRIVDAIEGLFADRLTAQVERLAHHALRGEMWDKALPTAGRRGPRRKRARPTGRPSHTLSRP